MRAIMQAIESAAVIAGCGRLLRVKNRCIHPPLSGCRDIMINIQLPVPRPDAAGTFFTHVCEIQIHHRRMKEHDDAENSHKVYEFFRDFFAGGERDTVEARMAALEAFGERLDAIGRSAGGAARSENGGGGGAAGGAEGGIADLGMLVAWVGRSETDVDILIALEEILRKELSELAAATHVSERLVALSGGADSLEHAAALFRMAQSAHAQGDHERALALLEEDLRIGKAALGDAHPEVAITLGTMAQVKKDQGDLAGALALLDESLRIKKAALGDAHPSVAITLHTMAQVKMQQGDLAGALALLDESLRIKKAALGDAHPEVAITLGTMAQVKRDQGDLAGALALLDESLRIKKAALGDAHPEVASTLGNMAQVKKDQGDLAGALALLDESLRIKKAALGDAHPTWPSPSAPWPR